MFVFEALAGDNLEVHEPTSLLLLTGSITMAGLFRRRSRFESK